METSLIHDPRTKLQIKDAIYNFLYQSIEQSFKKRIEDIISKNCVLCGNANQSFTYKGVVYCNPLEVPPRKMNRLVKQLIPVMDNYLSELKHLNTYELPYVMGFISQVLNASNHLPDYLKVFPQSIHQPIEELVLTCPCRANKLTQSTVEELQNKNQVPINLLKQRMVLNLIT